MVGTDGGEGVVVLGVVGIDGGEEVVVLGVIAIHAVWFRSLMAVYAW